MGETVLFLHGFGTDKSAWRHQIENLEPNYRVISLDHVGCGGSDLAAYDPQRYNSLYGYAHDVVEVCRAASPAGPVNVVAHSVSGMIALLASLQAPDLFHRLILLGSSARYLNDTGYQGGFSPDDVQATLDQASTNYSQWASGFAPAMVGVPRPDLAHYLQDCLGKMRPDVALSFLRVMLHSDFRKELGLVRHPTWILQTAKDAAVPEEAAQFLHRNIADSKYGQIPTEGHLPHISAPELVTRAIRSILTND